jgi:3-hydroxyacyl-CoA dehydrogenase/enoyl-CoA hydratase/3-hydroxybutyryl-CoA epimerase
MNETSTIDYAVETDGIATITWDMPGRPMNVMNNDSVRDFAVAVDRAVADESVKGVIVASGKDTFIAGGDLEMLERLAVEAGAGDSEDNAREIFGFVTHYQALLRRLETCGKPVVAAINGTALGGGLELCLACHYRVAADNPKAQLGLPEVKVGLLPGAGGTQRLPRLIGIQAAAPLLLEGKALKPQEALKLGIVHKVVPADALMAEARRWLLEEGKATQPWDEKGYRVPGGDPQSAQGNQFFLAANALLRQKTYGNYPAPQAILSCLYEGLHVPIDTGLKIEARYFTKLVLEPATRSSIRTLFFSMQALNKGARRPKGVPPYPIRKMGVLGAGMMGRSIAYLSAAAGIQVILIDASREAAEQGKQYAVPILDKAISRGKTTQADKEAVLARIVPTTDYSLLENADLVVEAVFEERSIKADVTTRAEAVMPPTAVFGSNTSTLPITGLAKASARPENFIGLHYFSPAEKMPLVEVIVGEKTSGETLAKALDYVKQIRKTPIVVNDRRGFYTSRTFKQYLFEGITMLAEGVRPALIENAGKMTGMPVAPLALTDEVSLELIHRISQQTRHDLGDEYQAIPADAILATMVDNLGRLGKKNAKGFYDYPKDGKKRLWPGLAEHWPAAAEQPDVAELKTRLLYIQALEAARIYEEGVVTDPREADVGAILGWGFAPWTGGPLSYIDTVGTEAFVAQCERLAAQHGNRFEPNALLREMAASGETFYGRFQVDKDPA